MDSPSVRDSTELNRQERGRPFEVVIAGLTDYLRRYARCKAAIQDHPLHSPQRTRRLLDRCGGPDCALAIIRVIGTKGKGSTAAMLEAALRAAGWHVGLYTSPHLHSPRERIWVDGEPISRPAFIGGLGWIGALLEESLAWDDLGPATLFEGLTTLAMVHFARYGVEVAVVEAGMGGRSDATQALFPRLTLLTPISLDHQAYLGDTLEAIATEKVAGVPPGGLVMSAPQQAAAWTVIQAHCREVGASLRQSTAVEVAGLGLQGPHQAINAGLVRAAAQALRELGWSIPAPAVDTGLRQVRWPGRLEVVGGRPLTVVDAAHNPAAAEALAAALVAEFPMRPHIFLLGCSTDKDLAGISAALAPLADGVLVTRSQHHRAASPEQLATLWRDRNVPVEITADVKVALSRARAWAGPAGLVCACGSLFIVAEVREALGLAVREPWPEPAVSY